MKTTRVQRTRQSTSDQGPRHSWLSRSDPQLRGTRTKYVITHNPSQHLPGEDVNISLSNLGAKHTIDPNSINLRFVFRRTDSKAKIYNNLSANLVQRLIVSIGGETIYDNAYENLMRTYTDLWLSQRAREELLEFGMCDELHRSGDGDDDSKGSGSSKDVSNVVKKMVSIFRHQKIPIGKITSDQGLMVPSANRQNLEFTIVLADPCRVVSSGSYSLDSMEVECDTVVSPSIRSLVVDHYTSGKRLPFRGLSWLHRTSWSKDNMHINENINVSRKCLNQIIMLFTRFKRNGSEEFVFPGIKRVGITIKGVPGAVYNAGIHTPDLLTEACKTFSGHMKPHDFFCNDMFALCIDLRSTFAPDEYGNGRDTSSGGSDINLEIVRDPDMCPKEDLWCYVYTTYDAILGMNTGGMTYLIS